MKKIFHFLYKTLGHLICRICLLYEKIRDRISPPEADSVLFVAHPDDDTLFFHTFIKEKKPYVALLTTGWSLRRLPDFFKVMKKYGVRCRVYDLEARDTRMDLIRKYVRQVKALKEFSLCATHNAGGEYGHEMHQRVHEAVMAEMNCKILCPVPADRITEHPLPDDIVKEKSEIFRKIYTTEIFVLDQYKDWVENEHLEEQSNG